MMALLFKTVEPEIPHMIEHIDQDPELRKKVLAFLKPLVHELVKEGVLDEEL